MTQRNALVRTGTSVARSPDAEFDFTGFRIFTSVPDHPDFGIAALNGMVVVYDERPLQEEGIAAGAFYVRESQRPPSSMAWDAWLNLERNERGRVGPTSPLRVRREVVQAIRWPNAGDWSVRLPSGHVDGPYHDWAFGIDLIGKVAGVYLPTASTEERPA